MTTKKLTPENVEYLVVHCSATPEHMDIGKKEIDRWHREKGWFGIGYHFVIRRDGELERGRDIGTPGAHVRGYNHCSVGVCLVGGVDDAMHPENNFTDDQLDSLEEILHELQGLFPKAKIVGHRDLYDGKACPSFDVAEWLEETTLK